MFCVSPSQVNFLVPEATAAGGATVRAFRGGAVAAGAGILVETAAPGLFAANSDGRGIGAIAAIRVDASGAQTVAPVSVYSSSCDTVMSGGARIRPESHDRVFAHTFNSCCCLPGR